jgi:hypothetical protein
MNIQYLLSVLYRNGLWISVLLFAVSAALLGFFILSVIRLVDRSKILSVPLVARQEVDFPAAGRVVLCMEGPLLTSRFAHLDYELRPREGMPIEGKTTWFHARTSSFSKVRMELKSYEITRPGSYILQVRGLEPGSRADSEHRIVFMRPHLVLSIGHVIGITLSAGLLIGSIVFFFIRLMEKGGGQ